MLHGEHFMYLVGLSDRPFNMKWGGSSSPGLSRAATFIHLQKQVNTTSSSAPNGFHPLTHLFCGSLRYEKQQKVGGGIKNVYLENILDCKWSLLAGMEQICTCNVSSELPLFRWKRGYLPSVWEGVCFGIMSLGRRKLVFQIWPIWAQKRALANPHGGGVRRKMTKICSLTGSHLYFSSVPLS